MYGGGKRSRGGGNFHKPSYILIWFRLHSLLFVATTLTCNYVDQVWYGCVAFSIIRRSRRDGYYYFYYLF